MKILFVLESYFPHHRAGTEVYVNELIKHLPGHGFKPNVLISSTDHSLQDYMYNGIQVFVFHVPGKPDVRELTGIIPPIGIEHFKQKIKSIGPDIIHFHSFGRTINGYHLKWAKEHGIRTVFTTHLSSFFCVKGDLLLHEKQHCDGKVKEYRCLNCYYQKKGIPFPISNTMSLVFYLLPNICRPLCPAQTQILKHRLNELDRLEENCDAIIAIAPWIKRTFELNGITEKLHLIKQGISVDTFTQKANNKPITWPVKLGFIGRISLMKGFHVLREALECIDSKMFELHIHAMQSSSEIEYFKYHKDWALSKPNVFWNENVSQKVLYQSVPDLDLLIFPSVNEMAPLTILEALAFKVPVLGSSIPSVRDSINDGVNGRLFAVNDDVDLKTKLSELLNDPGILKQWSSNIKDVKHTKDVAEEMAEIYGEITK